MRNVWESMGSRCESIIGIFSGQSSPVFPRFPLLRLFFHSHFIPLSNLLFLYSFFESSILHIFTLYITFIYSHSYIHTTAYPSSTSAPAKLSSECPAELPSYLSIPLLYSLFLPLFSIFFLSIHCLYLSPALHSVSFYTRSTCPPGAPSPPFR